MFHLTLYPVWEIPINKQAFVPMKHNRLSDLRLLHSIPKGTGYQGQMKKS